MQINSRSTGSEWKHGAQCGGGWQDQYTALHRDILNREPQEQRFVVAETHRSGLADRLTSAVPIFYFAMLTGKSGNVALIRGMVHLSWSSGS